MDRIFLLALALVAALPAQASAQEAVDPAGIYGTSYVLSGFGAALTIGALYQPDQADDAVLAASIALYGASELVMASTFLAGALGPDWRDSGLHFGVATALNFAGIGAVLATLVLRRPDDPEASASVRIGPGSVSVSGVF